MGVRMRKREKKSILFYCVSYKTRTITIISTSRRHAKYLEKLEGVFIRARRIYFALKRVLLLKTSPQKIDLEK